jgi:hypothetical protein
VPGAQEGLNRLAASRAADAYSVAMSRGFADAAAGRNARGARAFNQALALRPGAREAKDALASLDQASALGAEPARGAGAHRRERRTLGRGAHRLARGGEPRALARVGARRPHPGDARAELQRSIDV